ncbi:MAG: hypothetical protein QOJ76_2421 [Acidobacteriota bacterium]|jgi:hypothetical protein|nr:hypothetical protein [Acidobacteriota bacterium]
MKGRIFVVILLVAAAAFAGRWVNRMRSPQVNRQEETRQTFRLEPGARVEVSDINGLVEISTTETDTAEVHVVLTGDSPDDLEDHKVTVDASPAGLVVHGENGGGGRDLWRWLSGGGGQVKQEVTLALPRRVELLTQHVNGPLKVGEIDGSVEVAHINGRVEVAQSFGRCEVAHVNGNVKIGVAQLGAQGMEVEHVNGNIEIRLKQAINADIEVAGQNGSLSLNVPNVTMQERRNRSNARARLGDGGTPINIQHVNGNLRFESDAPAGSTTTNASTSTTTTSATATTSASAPSASLAPLPPPPPPAR